MTTSNQLLGRDAAPYVLEHDGKRFEFRALAQVEKSAWRAWLIERMRDVIALVYTGEDRAREMKKLTKDSLAGEYDFGGEVSNEAMATPDGVIRLASILAGTTPDGILGLWSEKPDEVKQLLELVVAESMRKHGYKENGAAAGAAAAERQGASEEAPFLP